MAIITINKQPTTIEEFVELRNQISITPEGGATLFLLAFKIFNENEELGHQCLVVAADQNSLTQGTVYRDFQLMKNEINLMKSQLSQNRRIPNSYISGTKVDDNYEVQLPYNYEFTTNAYSGDESKGSVKLFVKCSGADSPRPLIMIKNDKGIWKASQWSSVLVGIKKPAKKDDI
jgi:hypothetical protein